MELRIRVETFIFSEKLSYDEIFSVNSVWNMTRPQSFWFAFLENESHFRLLRESKLENKFSPTYERPARFPNDNSFSDTRHMLFWSEGCFKPENWLFTED